MPSNRQGWWGLACFDEMGQPPRVLPSTPHGILEAGAVPQRYGVKVGSMHNSSLFTLQIRALTSQGESHLLEQSFFFPVLSFPHLCTDS